MCLSSLLFPVALSSTSAPRYRSKNQAVASLLQSAQLRPWEEEVPEKSTSCRNYGLSPLPRSCPPQASPSTSASSCCRPWPAPSPARARPRVPIGAQAPRLQSIRFSRSVRRYHHLPSTCLFPLSSSLYDGLRRLDSNPRRQATG